jgi:hypothetical protein
MFEERENWSLIKQNGYIMLKLQDYIAEGNLEAVKVMLDFASNILMHVSLTKSMLIITQGFKENEILKEPRAKLREVHDERMEILNDLKVLKGFSNAKIPMEKVPDRYRESLEKFMFGKTATTDEKGGLLIYGVDFTHWLEKEKIYERYRVLSLGTSD